VYTVHASCKKGRPLPFRCPPAANLAGQEVSSHSTHFSASEVQQFGEDDKEETWGVLLYSFQSFRRPTLRRGGHYFAGPVLSFFSVPKREKWTYP
jgi:hypothetical protein